MELTRKSLLRMLLAVPLSLGLAVGIAGAPAPQALADEGGTVAFTDSAGREVQVPAEVTAVAPSGPLAQMVLLTFDPDIICGLATSPSETVEQYFGIDADDYIVFGQIYGGKGDFNKEQVAAAGTQLIIDVGEAKKTIVEDLDQIQADTNIPAVHIESSIATYDAAYTTLGELLGNPERGAELAEYCAKAYADTQAVVDTIPEDQRVTVAFVTDETHAIAKGSFQGQVVDNCAVNVVEFDDIVGNGQGNEISLEQLAIWDPQILFIGSEELYDKVASDPAWSTLTAVANGDYYLVPSLPFGWLNNPPGVNQLLGAQWFPRVCYPDAFDDDLQQVVTDYYKTMYGYDLSDEEWAAIAEKSAPATAEAAA